MNLSQEAVSAEQLMNNRESPLDPRTWDMSDRYFLQSGASGKYTPTPEGAGPASASPPTMPHQVSRIDTESNRKLYDPFDAIIVAKEHQDFG